MSLDEAPAKSPSESAADMKVRSRQLLNRGSFLVPKERIKVERSAGVATREPVRAEALSPARSVQAEHLSVKGRLHQRLLDELNDRGLLTASETELGAEVRSFVDRVLATEDIPLNEGERRRLADELLEETLGVGPLAPLMADPATTDILVNRFDQVY
ncbi:MAG TPA: hypothetical protein VHX68_03085, partial [Planctomycetaceae bacterium]|nr:hypothetical protein [Planctomycetaceae bacterium]